MTQTRQRSSVTQFRWTCSIGAAILLAARCSDASDGAPRAPSDSVFVAPATKEAIIVIEGMAEPMTLHRYESPPEAPLAFSTYLPEGILAEGASAASDEWSVTFRVPATQGSGSAAMEFVVLPEGTTEEEGRARAEERARELAPGELEEFVNPEERQAMRWGLAEYPLHGNQSGVVTLGEQEERFFLLLVRHAPESGDGFLPRASWILEEWVWEATGNPLQALESR